MCPPVARLTADGPFRGARRSRCQARRIPQLEAKPRVEDVTGGPVTDKDAGENVTCREISRSQSVEVRAIGINPCEKPAGPRGTAVALGDGDSTVTSTVEDLRRISHGSPTLGSYHSRRRACRGSFHRLRRGAGCGPPPLKVSSGRISIAGTSNVHDYTATTTDARVTRVRLACQCRGRGVLGREYRSAAALEAFDISHRRRDVEVFERRPRQEHVQGAQGERTPRHHLPSRQAGRRTRRADRVRHAAHRRSRAGDHAAAEDRPQGRDALGQRRNSTCS